MERMINLARALDDERLIEKIEQLEQENKKLKEKLEKCNEVSAIDFERGNEILQLRDKIQRLEFDVNARHQLKLLLEGEIEKLKEYNGELIENHKKDIAILCEENKNLKDKIDHLEFDINAWKKLKAVWEKKEQKLQIDIGGLMGERDGLKMVVERLHKEIEEQEAEGGGLFDEIDYRKREAKRLGWKPNK